MLLERRQVQLRDIMQVAESREFGGPQKLDQIYEWQAARLSHLAKALGGTATALLTTILVAFLKDELEAALPIWVVVLFIVAMLSLWSVAAYLTWRWSKLPTEYASALRAYRLFTTRIPNFPSKPW